MTTPVGQISTTDVSSELGRLTIPLTGGTVDRTNEYIQISADYVGYGNRVANGDVVTYFANGVFGVISGLSNNSQYYVKNANNTYTQLAVGSSSNSAVNLDSTGYTSGKHWFTRSTAPFSMNDERVRRLADKTTGAISFNDLRNKNVSKSYDSGTALSTVSSRRRNPGGIFAIENDWNVNSTDKFYWVLGDEPGSPGYNTYALDYFVFDTSAYANAGIQSGNLTFTVLVSFYNMEQSETYLAAIPFIKPTNYNTTAEPNAVTITDSGNQNDVTYLSDITNTYTSGIYTFGNIVFSYPLQTKVSAVGQVGGWSVGSTGQWNTSKLSSTLHALSLNFKIGARGEADSYGMFRVHSCRMTGTYTL